MVLAYVGLAILLRMLHFRSATAAGLVLFAFTTACQRGPLQATAHLPATTSQPVGAAIVPDAGAADYIRPFHEQVEKQMQVVIGTAPVALGKNPGENPIVNFVADLQRTAASRYFKGEVIELGVMTNGGMRNSLPAGPITIGNAFELMPFENELVVLEAPGPVVQQLFDYSAPIGMAVSGATYAVGPDKRPQQILIGGQPFDPAKTYRIAISDYLAGGGDHMEFLKAAKLRHTGLLLRTSIIDHIKALTAAGQPVTAKVEGRVRPQI
jgi:2',3'-cyclic-nucleotide 2'-phosphodiesterase (5'-nucleotidase family)